MFKLPVSLHSLPIGLSQLLNQFSLTRTYHLCSSFRNKIKRPKQIREAYDRRLCSTTVKRSNNTLSRKFSLTFYKKRLCHYKANIYNQQFFHSSSYDSQHDDNNKGSVYERTMPKIFYYQSPLVWLRNKLNFRKLCNTWDPNFNEAEFTRGSKQAVSLITKIINNDEFDSLEGLLTKKAAIAIRKEVVLLWRDEVKRHIALDFDDIQLAVPTKIHFNLLEEDAERKICDIDMWFMALKWVEGGALLIIDIATRFNRDYEEENLSDWTISIFQVRRFHVRHPRPR